MDEEERDQPGQIEAVRFPRRGQSAHSLDRMLHGFPSFPHTTQGAAGKAPGRAPIIADLAPLKVSFPALLKEKPMREAPIPRGTSITR
jgi:hypothetical protein